MKTTLKQKKKQYRTIYELLFAVPRMYKKDICALLKLNDRTVAKRLKEAFEQRYIVGPDIRKRSHSNTQEHIYFLKCENPELAYLKYREDENVIYHAQMSGFCDLWIIAKEKIDVEGNIILEGPRSDYYTSYAPDHSWETAVKIMQEKMEKFNPSNYKPKNIIQTHFNETIEWDEEDEFLYRYFKYNLRKTFAPVMRKHGISGSRLYKFLERLPETCTIATSYYPDSLPAYESYLYVFETDYEDFIIDLFSELPTTTSFFKVSDRLVMSAYIAKTYVDTTDLTTDISTHYISPLIVELLRKKIVKKKDHAIAMYFKGKSL